MIQKELSVVIPAYNEEQAIGQVIQHLLETLRNSGWRFEIIAVNDGSTDQTAKAAEEAGAKVVSHPKNSGYGRALRTGIEAASFDWIATIDADNSYPPEELLKLLPHTDRFDMVIGARQGALFWGNFIKHPARLLFLALAQFVVGEKIPDANSGLRIFKKSITQQMLPRLCSGFSFSTTLTLSFMSSHCFVEFVPIDYHSRMGQSKVRYFKDTLRTLQLIFETILYYNPIKANLLLVLFPFMGSFLTLIVYIFRGDAFYFFISLFLFCWALLLLALGFIMFLISQALNKPTQS